MADIRYSIMGSTLSDIANAIREKTGFVGGIKGGEFAGKIRGIEQTGGDTTAALKALARNELTSYSDPELTELKTSVFAKASNLVEINIPNATIIEGAVLANTGIKKLILPNVVTFKSYAVRDCTSLEILDLGPALTSSVTGDFVKGCTALKAFVIRKALTTTQNLSSEDSFATSGVATGIGYVYVPRDVISKYTAGTGWSTYADRFRALEDYTVDGTVTGALDESKI